MSDSLWRAEQGNEGDLASGLRQQFPLDRKELDEAIKYFDARGLAFQIRIVEWLLPFVSPGRPGRMVNHVLWAVYGPSIVGVIFAVNDGLFSSAQIIGGIFAALVVCASFLIGETAANRVHRRSNLDLATLLLGPFRQFIRRKQLIHGELDMKGEGEDSEKEPEKLVSNLSKGLSRNVSKDDPEKELAKPASRLLEHVPGDEFCPCSECLKDLPRSIFWDSMVQTSSCTDTLRSPS